MHDRSAYVTPHRRGEHPWRLVYMQARSAPPPREPPASPPCTLPGAQQHMHYTHSTSLCVAEAARAAKTLRTPATA